jgi:dTDP-4-amino-4,6-dideoxygalactose transaminase
MRLRSQPPVHSPLSLEALRGGVVAALGGGAAARARVVAALQAGYAPHGLLLTDSGTSALALALQLAARERPGPAALPAFCCYDIATAVDAAGVPFLLYDLDPHTLAPDRASLDRAIAAGAGTVVVVHLYGVPVDIDGLRAALAGVVLVEDAAQAAGARLAERPAGTRGRYGVLSFGRGKGVTGGRGGALLGNNEGAGAAVEALEARLAPAPGAGAAALLAQWLLARPSVYGLPSSLPFLRLGETVYHAAHPPGRLSAFALGVLAHTQALAAAEAAVRRTHAQRLLDLIGTGAMLRAYVAPAGTQAGYLRLPVLLPESAAAAADGGESRRLGIWPSYPRSLADLPGFGERRLNPQDEVPGARALAQRLVTLPTHGQLQVHDLEALERWVSRRSGAKER